MSYSKSSNTIGLHNNNREGERNRRSEREGEDEESDVNVDEEDAKEDTIVAGIDEDEEVDTIDFADVSLLSTGAGSRASARG